jgi:hypothetical protein
VSVLEPALATPVSTAALAQLFARSAPRAVFVPGAITAAAAAVLRALADAAAWSRFDVADRGSYHEATLGTDPLLDELAALACAITGEELAPIAVRARRLRHGDYSLMKGDARSRPAGLLAELVVDLSDAATGEAEVSYTDGSAALVVVPQLPRSLALVERTPAIHRHERYLTHRIGAREVVRLYVELGPRGSGGRRADAD